MFVQEVVGQDLETLAPELVAAVLRLVPNVKVSRANICDSLASVCEDVSSLMSVVKATVGAKFSQQVSPNSDLCPA